MKIVIFGATGIVGKAVVNEALSKGYDVSVLTRDAKKVSIKHRCLHVYEGNVMDRNTVHNILNGKDAVIHTLGIGGKGNGKPTNCLHGKQCNHGRNGKKRALSVW